MAVRIRTTAVFVSVLILVLTPLAAMAGNGWSANRARDAVSGLWYTEGRDGGVELYHCGDKICGRFYWFNPKGEEAEARDASNPDPEKRDRNLCRLQFMGDFTPDGHGHYTDGWIYSPRHGQTFSAELTLIDHDTLDLHGYILSPILGDSQTWKRAKAMPACARG